MKAKTGLTLFAVAASGLLAALVSYGKVGADGAARKAAPTPPPRPARP